MAVSGKVADGVIKIALAGLEATKAQLTQLQTNVKKLNESLGTIGSASSKGFAAATGSIIGFLKAADPVRFEIFTQKLQVLAMYVGLSFIPILEDAIGVLDRLIDYFRNLSDEQREQILHWTKVGVAILAVGTAVGGIVATLPKLLGLIRAVQVAISILTTSTGVGIVLALVGAALAVMQLTGAFDKLQPVFDRIMAVFGQFTGNVLGPLMDTLTGVAHKVVEAFGKVAERVAPVLATIGEAIGKAFEALGPVIDQLGDSFGELVAEVAPLFADLAREFGALFAEVAPLVAQLAGEFGRLAVEVGRLLIQVLPPLIQIGAVLMRLYVTYQATLARILIALASAAASVLPAFGEVLGVVAQAVQELTPTLVQLTGVFAEVIGIISEVVAEMMKLGGEVLAGLIRDFASLAVEVMRAFGPAIISAIRTVVSFARQCLEVIKDIVRAAKELVETAKSLNPFGRQQVRERTSRPSGAGDFANGSGSASGPEDFGGPGPGAGGGRMDSGTGWWRTITERMAAAVGQAVARPNERNNAARFVPMARPVKVETFGIEEAFRKAQQGASFDPAKIAENERRRMMQEQTDRLAGIERNTARQPGAVGAR